MSDDNRTQSTDSLLFAEGSRSFQFSEMGAVVSGTVLEAEARQQSDLETGELLTWPDGRKRMMLVVTLQTIEHDNDDDDGIRQIYAKGGRYEVVEGEGTSMLDAIRDALRAAGVKTSEEMVGSELAVGWTGVGKRSRIGFNPPKLYSASFKKGAKSLAGLDLFGDGGNGA